MVLVGHNGAGKSTFINYLLGFYTHLNQHPFLEHFSKHLKPFSNKRIGYAPEAAVLNLQMNAFEYFKMMSTLNDVKEFDIHFELKRVMLDVDVKLPLKKYSKGMKQRFLLALALMGRPEIVILDEPTSGLDPFGQEIIERLLITLKDEYKFVICTHSMKLAYELKDEVWIIKEGEIVLKNKFDNLETLKATMLKFQPEHLQ